MPGEPLLRAEGIAKRFGAVAAVDGMSIEVSRGELVALIGPNGAGKTTFFQCVTGTLAPDAGTVWFDGKHLVGLAAHRVARLGLVRTFQITRALGRMTVMENMLLAAQGQLGERAWAPLVARKRVREQERGLARKARDLLEFFEIEALRESYAGALSGGQRKLLELARALMTEPKMLLLDEPVAGVNPTLTEKLMGKIRELRDQGLTFLVVEHNMDVVMRHFGRIVVMAEGKRLAEGTPEQVKGNPAVIEAYLGG